MVTATHLGKEIKLTLDKADVFDYLIDLRDSGITNMLGARQYIVDDLGCGHAEASYWLFTWIKSF